MIISVLFLGLGIAGVLIAGLLAGFFIQRRLNTKRIGDANDLAPLSKKHARKPRPRRKKFWYRGRTNFSTRNGNWKTNTRNRNGS